MTYRFTLDKLFKATTSQGIKLGLENSQWINAQLNHPEQAFSSIHVAGTNGKGSVCTKIATALEHAGYKTGLYTSPHISTFRERIKINGKMISENDVVEIMDKIFRICNDNNRSLTFFELTTALALVYFAEQKIDFVVLETGLGGRLDATNTTHPILSIITTISYDHMDFLGITLEEIADEKAGIIKHKVPIIIGPKVPFDIIQEKASLCDAPLMQVQGSFKTYDQENTAIAGSALTFLSPSLSLSPSAVEKGLKAIPPSRLEIFDREIMIILDVAHNPDGIKELLKSISSLYPKSDLEFVCGFSLGKDIFSCLEELKKHAKHLHLVCSSNQRGISAAHLKEVALNAGFSDSELSTYSQVSEGLTSGIQQAKVNQRLLVVCGSFFIMAEVRKTLNLSEPSDPMDLN